MLDAAINVFVKYDAVKHVPQPPAEQDWLKFERPTAEAATNTNGKKGQAEEVAR